MGLYARQGRLVAKPGQGAALAAVLLDADTGLSTMPGCRLYLLLTSEAEPDTLLVTEVWDSPEAHQASLQLPGVVAAMGRARPLLDRAEGGPLTLVGGFGLE